MSLLLPIRGQIPLANQDVETAVIRLCQGLLAHSRLAAHAVVAARFEAGPGIGDAKEVLQAARGCGWEGIPLFLAHRPSDPGVLRVEAHVRVKRRRRFRDVVVDPELSAVGTCAAATGAAATGAAATGAAATGAAVIGAAATGAAGTGAAATGAAATGAAPTGAAGTGAEATGAAREPGPNHRSSP